jgi:hypothetical protein
VPSAAKGSGRHIRQAKPGGWAEHMTREEIRAMHEILAPKLTELGYMKPGDKPARRAA